VSDGKAVGNTRRRALVWGALAAVVAAGLVAFEAYRTRAVRGAVRSFAALVTAANDGDLAAAEGLCSRRYLARQRLELADEGGIVGLPRNVNKNFQAWREGNEVWICPTNRVGPVYRFILENGAWRFDGPIGLLMPDGRVERSGLPDDAPSIE
jgi:hypothetical protein